MERVRVGKRGVIVIPKTVRDKLGIEEGMILSLRIEDNRIIIETSDLWTELRRRGRRLKVHVDKVMEELDEADAEWSGRLGK